MKKIAAILFTSALIAGAAAPAWATCQEEIDATTAALETAQVSEETKGEVMDALEEATGQAASGDEDACMATVADAKALLGM